MVPLWQLHGPERGTLARSRRRAVEPKKAEIAAKAKSAEKPVAVSHSHQFVAIAALWHSLSAAIASLCTLQMHH